VDGLTLVGEFEVRLQENQAKQFFENALYRYRNTFVLVRASFS
jgi:hypothetical protein